MTHTNRGRVLIGGLLAGVVINIVEYVTNGVLLKQEWAQVMQGLGKPSQLGPGAIVMFNIWGFLLGIGAVWLYAAIRPRYGSGPNTAIRAAVAAWVLTIILSDLINLPLGLFPARLLLITAAVELLELIAATLVGARVYREAEEAPKLRRAAA
jgi:hypothetical protein